MSLTPSSRDPAFVHILTAGRTGSTYVAEMLEVLFPELAVYQEREPARMIAVLTNLGDLGCGPVSTMAKRAAERIYKTTRKGRLRHNRKADGVVEINPFIVNLGARLAEPAPTALIHFVRHPVAWVQSSIEFGSYSWRRPIVPYLPLVRERPPLGDASWAHMTETERFAWRWQRRNANIREFCAAAGVPVLTLRYEDAFERGMPQTDAFRALAGLMRLDQNRVTDSTLPRNRVNPTLSTHRQSEGRVNRNDIMAICADEAAHYGYE